MSAFLYEAEGCKTEQMMNWSCIFIKIIHTERKTTQKDMFMLLYSAGRILHHNMLTIQLYKAISEADKVLSLHTLIYLN